MRRALFAVAAIFLAPCAYSAQPASLVTVGPKDCKHGLHQQPNGGPFSVFVFCDDAAGVNIGVINATPGAGPGSIDIRPSREWNAWGVNDRFWQDHGWATDITSFAWSPDLRALYVGTSEIYGTGSLYKLDLVNRKSEILLPKADWKMDPKVGYSTHILGIDAKTGNVSVEFSVDERKSVRKLEVK